MNDVRKSDAVVDFVMANILHPPVEARRVEWESTLDYTSLGKKIIMMMMIAIAY